LGLLFGITNILSLWRGNSRTHLLEKEKKMNEKNVDDHGSTKKKIETKIKSQIMVSSTNFLVKNKRQIVILFYPSCLNQGRKRLATH
jgi:hypothetical protein